MTHIIKISCGDEVFAKGFEEKVVVAFSMKRRTQEGLRKKKKTERERGEPFRTT